jgi:hypothetical protein
MITVFNYLLGQPIIPHLAEETLLILPSEEILITKTGRITSAEKE